MESNNQQPVEQAATNPVQAPIAHKPFNTGKIVLIFAIVTLVSWGIIGAIVAYAMNSDIVGKTQKNISDKVGEVVTDAEETGSDMESSSGTTNSNLSAYEELKSDLSANDSRVKFGNYTVSLSGESAKNWKFFSALKSDNCSNYSSANSDSFCYVAELTPSDNQTDIRPFTIGIAKNITALKTLGISDAFGIGEQVTVKGAKEAYLYNKEYQSNNNYVTYHALFAVLDEEDVVVYVVQSDGVHLFKNQADMDADSERKYKMLLSVADEAITSIVISKQ